MRHLHHLCIQTDCYDESLTFYCEILDFKMVKETKNFHTRLYNTWLDYEGFMIELQTNKKDEVLIDYSASNKGIVHFCFVVDNIEAEYKRIKSLGYHRFKSKNEKDIYVVEGGKLMKIISPEGTIIEMRDNQEIL